MESYKNLKTQKHLVSKNVKDKKTELDSTTGLPLKPKEDLIDGLEV